jgi:hypothetical protein
MTMTMTIALLSIISACTLQDPQIYWEGYLFQQSAEGMVPLEDATIEVLNEAGEFLTDGSVPDGRPSHYQRVTMETEWLNQPLGLRVGNTNSMAMVWTGQSPSKDATWLPGGLFALDESFGTEFLNSFATTVDVPLEGPVHLWGEPFHSEEWIDVIIVLFDDEQEYPVYTFSQLSNGLISTSIDTGIDWFFAWNLPAKPLTLQITLQTGDVVQTQYAPQDGDILSALYYALPQEDSE